MINTLPTAAQQIRVVHPHVIDSFGYDHPESVTTHTVARVTEHSSGITELARIYCTDGTLARVENIVEVFPAGFAVAEAAEADAPEIVKLTSDGFDDQFAVRGLRGDEYRVTSRAQFGMKCTCKGFRFAKHCKHIKATFGFIGQSATTGGVSANVH